MPKHGSIILYVHGNQEGSLGRTAQDVHLDSHTAPELWLRVVELRELIPKFDGRGKEGVTESGRLFWTGRQEASLTEY